MVGPHGVPTYMSHPLARCTGGVPNTLHDCDDSTYYVKSGVGFLADVATHKMTFCYVL
jgi:glycogen synthase